MKPLATVDLGAGEVRDFDFDWRVDLREVGMVNYVSDIRFLPRIESGSVAYLKCAATLEHLLPQDQITAVREMYRILAPHGIAVIQTPDREWIPYAVERGYITKEWADTLTRGGGENPYDYHLGLLSARDLEWLFHICGFRVLTARDGKQASGSLEFVFERL